MRLSVFVTVWLGLVLSPLKAVSSTVNETAPEPTEVSILELEDEATATAETTTTGPSDEATATAETPTTGPSDETTATAETTTSGPTDETTATTETPTTETPTTGPSDNSTVNATTPATTKTPTTVDFCHGDPCGRNLATCISLNSNYTCRCEYGFYYSDKNCYRGRVFPATIEVKATYSENLHIVNSTEYEELVHNISAFFKKAFAGLPTYVDTVVMEIKPQGQSRNYSPLNVTVTNLFTLNTTENEESVRTAVENAINSDNDSFVTSYEVADPCDVYECDTKTTVCQASPSLECICKDGLEKTEWDDRSCSACSKSCSTTANKYCVKEDEVPTCKCMPKYRNESEECVPCPVGFSGENCSDNTELILIIVGTVLGAIILSLVIAVSVISVRAKRKQNPEKRSLIKPGYSDINTSDDRPSMFPRVQTTSGHANPGYQPNNPYEMQSTNRDRFPERDYDDLYEISREPRGLRAQSRY